MLKYLIIAGLAIIVIALIMSAARQGPPPPQPLVIDAVYNATDGRLYIAATEPVAVGGLNSTRHVVLTRNGSYVRVTAAGVPLAFYIEYRYRVVEVGDAYYVAEVANTGNATVRYSDATVRPGESAAVRVERSPPPELFSVSLQHSVKECDVDRCTVYATLTVSGPPGEVSAYVADRQVSVKVNTPQTFEVSVPYGRRLSVYVPAAGRWVNATIAPRIDVRLLGVNLTCGSDSCRYVATLAVYSEVRARVRIGGSEVELHPGSSTVQIEVPFGRSCLTAVPTDVAVCISTPYIKPAAVVRRVYYYYSVHPLTILEVYNPGVEKLDEEITCIGCVQPPQTLIDLVRLSVNPPRLSVPPRSVAVAAFYGPSVQLVLGNGTVYKPPPPPPRPPVKIASVQAARQGDNVLYVITFEAPNIDYASLLWVEAGGQRYGLTCSANVCQAEVPSAAVARLQPLNVTLVAR